MQVCVYIVSLKDIEKQRKKENDKCVSSLSAVCRYALSVKLLDTQRQSQFIEGFDLNVPFR